MGKTSEYISRFPNSLDLKYSRIKYPDSAFIEDLIVEFVNNININEDNLVFDVIAGCTIILGLYNYETQLSQLLKIYCSALITYKLENLAIKTITPYSQALPTSSEGK